MVVWLAGCVLPGIVVAGGDPVRIGDPAHPETLSTTLVQAYRRGRREMTINPGSYLLPVSGGKAIELDGWQNTTIHARGVTLVIAEPARAAVVLKACENVVLEGATLRFDALSSTQGKIKNIGEDDEGKFVDWQIDAGYPATFAPARNRCDIVDAGTRRLKAGTGDVFARDVQVLGPTLLRLRGVGGNLGGATIGDWVVASVPGGNSLVHLQDSKHCTLQGVTVQNAGFAAFFETGGEGAHHYLDCRIARGPRPPGAVEETLVACGADGFHSASTKTGPTLEHCTWEGVLLDDCIAIHGSYCNVIRTEGNRLTIEERNPDGFEPGDPVRVSSKSGFFGEAICTGYRRLDGSANLAELTLDRRLAVPDRAVAGNPGRCGSSYRILHCALGNTRSRGILVKGDNGIVAGCAIDGCGMSAVSIGPEYYWGESDYCKNVSITANTFGHNNLCGGNAATVWVHGEGALGNRAITIVGNSFSDNYGSRVIGIESADGVRVENNRVSLLKTGPGCVIGFANTRNVFLKGNTVTNATGAGSLVRLGEGVIGVSGDDQTGISATISR